MCVYAITYARAYAQATPTTYVVTLLLSASLGPRGGLATYVAGARARKRTTTYVVALPAFGHSAPYVCVCDKAYARARERAHAPSTYVGQVFWGTMPRRTSRP